MVLYILFRHLFEHNQYNIPAFTPKSQNRANIVAEGCQFKVFSHHILLQSVFSLEHPRVRGGHLFQIIWVLVEIVDDPRLQKVVKIRSSVTHDGASYDG